MRGRRSGGVASRRGWVVALVVSAAACSAEGPEPPVVALGPPSGVQPEVSAPAVVADPSNLCELADAAVLADVTGWTQYVPALEAALPPEVDVAAFVAELTPDTAATPTVTATLDLIWDVVDQRCETDPLVPQCRALLTIAVADPVGWAVRAQDPAEVEAAFAVAVANWSDLRRSTVDDDGLRPAIDAHLRFLEPAGERLAEVGWAPGRIDALEPLEPELIALGSPEVVEPLAALEHRCGLT